MVYNPSNNRLRSFFSQTSLPKLFSANHCVIGASNFGSDFPERAGCWITIVCSSPIKKFNRISSIWGISSHGWCTKSTWHHCNWVASCLCRLAVSFFTTKPFRSQILSSISIVTVYKFFMGCRLASSWSKSFKFYGMFQAWTTLLTLVMITVIRSSEATKNVVTNPLFSYLLASPMWRIICILEVL